MKEKDGGKTKRNVRKQTEKQKERQRIGRGATKNTTDDK
jgi:hypothetical protein